MTLTTTINKASRSAVRKDGYTADEISIVNHAVERLDKTQPDGSQIWAPYGTVAGLVSPQNTPHIKIVRVDDAKPENQPLKDVIDGDTLRLGRPFRGRTKNTREAHQSHKRNNHNRRGHAPVRNHYSRGACGPVSHTSQADGAAPATHHSSDFRHGPRGSHGTHNRAKTQSRGPGNVGADKGRSVAHPGSTNRSSPSRSHRRPAQKVARGRQAGDVAAPVGPGLLPPCSGY